MSKQVMDLISNLHINVLIALMQVYSELRDELAIAPVIQWVVAMTCVAGIVLLQK